MADKVKQLKADEREANRQAKLEREAKDRLTILRLQELWLRFGLAREQAGVSIPQACAAAKKYYNAAAEKEIKELEDNTGSFNVNTTQAPYGQTYDLRYINTLCTLANLFDCSVDYLLCRTNDPKPIPAAVSSTWNVGEPANLGQYVAIARFEASTSLRPFILTWTGDEWQNGGIPIAECGVEVIGWAEMPEVE